MEAIILLLTQVIPPLIQLGINVIPLIGEARNAIDALSTGNHITPDQAADLHAQTEALESQWAAVLQAAQDEDKT